MAVYPIQVSGNGRYLMDQNDVPFLLNCDSARSAMTMLTAAQMDTYLANRATRKFNAVMVDVLCSTATHGNADGSTYDGILPFTSGTGPSTYDLTTPNNNYFNRLDLFISKAADNGLLVVLEVLELISWLITAQNNSLQDCFDYGAYVGNRYTDTPNVMWLHGNDFQTYTTQADNDKVVQVMAGIASVDSHLQTIELNYWRSYSSQDTDAWAYCAINGVYTYADTYDYMLVAYNAVAAPTVMVEANYEYEDLGVVEDGRVSNLRRQEYWTMLSGGAGHLYGNYYVNQSRWPGEGNLDTTGVTELGYLMDLFTPRPWHLLVPDQAHTTVTAGYGTYRSTAVYDISNSTYATAARASDGSTILCFCPVSTTITVDMTKLSAQATAQWYDPTDGSFSSIAGSPFNNTGTQNFATPGNNSSGAPDWVLVLDAQVATPVNINPVVDTLNGGVVRF